MPLPVIPASLQLIAHIHSWQRDKGEDPPIGPIFLLPFSVKLNSMGPNQLRGAYNGRECVGRSDPLTKRVVPMELETLPEKKATEVGSYFVANYPPFSIWSPEHKPAILAALDRPPRP